MIELSPFIITSETDQGYIAVDALAGGRTNMPIKTTPASISSLTRTFLNDLAIQDVREALQWAPNVVPTDPLAGKGFGGQAFHSWSYNFRGAGAGQQGGPGPTRNYFAFFQNPDAYNIERVEFTRGPNSILFGLGTVGGTLSTYTKVPRLDRTFISPAITVDDNGSVRAELDYNVAASENLAFRVNALWDRTRGWQEGDEGEKQAIDLAMLYKLTDRTTLRVELEGARFEQTLFGTTIADKTSGWDGTTISETWGAAPTGGTARTIPIQNAGAWGDWLTQFPVLIAGRSNARMDFWAGGFASSSSLADPGAALNWAPHAGWYPEQVRLGATGVLESTAAIPVRPSREWTYGNGVSDSDFEDITVFLDHRFNESFDLQLSYYRFNIDQEARNYEGTGGAAIDINRQQPNGDANLRFGQPFADFFLSKQTQDRMVNEYRAQLNYNYTGELFGRSWTQVVGLSASKRETQISARQYLAQIASPTDIDNPADWVQNMVWGRIYLNQPNERIRIPESVNDQTIAYLPNPVGYWFDFDDEFNLTSLAAFSHTRLLDDDLSIALGIRRDDYDEDLRELRRGPDATDRFLNESDHGMTYTAGLVYYFGWLGVFANYSENILPPNPGSQPYISGERPRSEEGRGFDYGFRISTDDGRYYATLSRYDTESENRNVENPVAIRGIWQAYNVARGESQDVGLGSLAYSDTTSLEVSGYEFELTANPTNNLRIQASYGRPDAEVVDFYPMSRAHMEQNLAAWNEQLAATADETLAANLRNAIATAQNTLDQAQEGAPQQGLVDYTASLFANYSFLEGPLDGWSIGAGATYTGKRYLATFEDQRYYGNSFNSIQAVIAYETRFGDVQARFALNVDNLLDEDDPVVTSYHWGYQDEAGRHVRDGYYYQVPRRFRFTARFTF